MRWEKEILSWPGGVEERYMVALPVFGRMVLRRHRDNGPWTAWTIGPFGEHGHELRPGTARGAKAAARRHLLSRLREAEQALR